MTEKMVSIAPTTEWIDAECKRQGMSWEIALGEPIDNSLDAGATRIVISINKKSRRVTFQDNGDGCAEPHMMFVTGHSTKRGAKNMLGRYGVGLKHSSLYFCGKTGTTTIITMSGGICRSISVVWGDLCHSRAWEIRAPEVIASEEVKAHLPDNKGTCIKFMNVKPGFLTSIQLQDIFRKLSFIFSPALRSGKQIEIHVDDKPTILRAPDEPSWKESMCFDVDIDGRTAKVRAGILNENDSSGRRGMSFCYGHRVIRMDSNDGCGSYSTTGFAGIVDLDPSWNLGQNKTEIVDDDLPRLLVAIEERVRPLLEKIKNSTHQLQSEAIRNATANLLNSIIGTGQPKRPNKRGEERTKEKTIKRNVRTATTIAGVGDAIGRRSKVGALTIDWEDDQNSPYAARVDPNFKCVYLNRRKTVIGDAYNNSDFRFLAIVAASHLFEAMGRDHLPGYFAVQMGTLLSESISLKSA